jgi:hypothetical protein
MGGPSEGQVPGRAGHFLPWGAHAGISVPEFHSEAEMVFQAGARHQVHDGNKTYF